MNNIKKLLSLLLAVAILVSMAACAGEGGANNTTAGGSVDLNGEMTSYNVLVQTAGSMPLKGVAVQVYAGNELQAVADTGEDGKAYFELPKYDGYTIKLNKVQEGYKLAESYTFTGNNSIIILKSELIASDDLSGKSFEVGDVMHDFVYTDTEGNTRRLSDALKEKKMVLLNFFYTTCGPCADEVPYMEEAYGMYKDEVEVICLNPFGADVEADVAAFKANYGLSFAMAKVPSGWATMAGGGYPTNYVIDRFGVVTVKELGGIKSLRPFTSIMEYFTADDYKQTLVTTLDQIITRVPPTEEDMAPEDIAAILGNADGNVTYRNEVDDEYSWPFINMDKNGEVVMGSTNKGIDASYSILYMDVTLKAGQAIAFDYMLSTEAGADLFYVIMNETPIYTMSGADKDPVWKSCYPWVATEDGTYQIGITYIKDDSDPLIDPENPPEVTVEDRVYLKNVRIVDASEVDVPTYLPREAALDPDGDENYVYEEIVLGADGYYHVGSANGPLVLANLMGVTQFAPDNSIYLMALDGAFKNGDKDYVAELTPFASYAAGSKLTNYCTVNKELGDLLTEIFSVVGFEDDNAYEWLKICKYYAAYGTNGAQMPDPIEGLATFSAIPASLGNNNVLPYDEGIALMPRGKLAKFVAPYTGVYYIASHCENPGNELHGWVFGDEFAHLIGNTESKSNLKAESLRDERFIEDPAQATMYCFMEAGKTYYIDIAYWDPYTVGRIPFSIEYLGATYDYFRMCSPGPFTYIELPDGGMGETIHGGINAVLNPADGYYHHDLGKDANGNQIYGSIIYADFLGTYTIINKPIYGSMGLLDLGAFNFSMTENDQYIYTLLKSHNGDQEAVEAYLKEAWGEDLWESKKAEYHLDDVFEGIYHGKGQDMSPIVQKYVSQMIPGNGVNQGCVPVTEELAEVLQMLMDKYTFEGVDQSWLKLCYYYDYMGRN